MSRTWTFNQRVNASFAVLVALTAVIGVISVGALRSVAAIKNGVITVNAQNVIDAAVLKSALNHEVAEFRGFLLTGGESYLAGASASQAAAESGIARIEGRAVTAVNQQLIAAVRQDEAAYQEAQRSVQAARRSGTLAQAVALFAQTALPQRDKLVRDVAALTAHEQASMEAGTAASDRRAADAEWLVAGLAGALVLLAVLLGVLLARRLRRDIGAAVQHVQSSSSELQAAANQQAAGAKESATAMSEIATTMSELLASSRQIAASARQVAQIAGATTGAARAGEEKVDQTSAAIAGIRQQVDTIVNHMLELGRKSQQIGGVLDIINELAEQTNILSINASIEAAGAGEAGRRFAVVGEEIRKLAERVGGATKEVRGLIEEIRAAVNTTVMATESGSKAVDTGRLHFTALSDALREIVAQVATATEASREIELSTQQQSTAVEQVNAAITGAAQATRETEASTGETLQTAVRLTTLSRDLARIVQAEAAG